MRIPLSWLQDYVQVDLAPETLAEQLTLRGMEVSSIEITGSDWTDVVVGRLLTVERHPNADKLWLTTVDVGADATVAGRLRRGQHRARPAGPGCPRGGGAARESPHRAGQDPRRHLRRNALLGRRAWARGRCVGNSHPRRRRHLPAGHGPAPDPGRGGPGRRREAEPWRCPVDGRPCARDRRHHWRRAAPTCGDARRGSDTAHGRARDRRDRGRRGLSTIHRTLVRGRRQRPITRMDAAAPAGCWNAAHLGGR